MHGVWWSIIHHTLKLYINPSELKSCRYKGGRGRRVYNVLISYSYYTHLRIVSIDNVDFEKGACIFVIYIFIFFACSKVILYVVWVWGALESKYYAAISAMHTLHTKYSPIAYPLNSLIYLALHIARRWQECLYNYYTII